MTDAMKKIAKARIMNNERLRGLWDEADEEIKEVMLLLALASKERIDAATHILKKGV